MSSAMYSHDLQKDVYTDKKNRPVKHDDNFEWLHLHLKLNKCLVANKCYVDRGNYHGGIQKKIINQKLKIDL